MAVDTHEKSAPGPARAVGEEPRFAAPLALWAVLTVVLYGVLWLTGFRAGALNEAVEEGAAQVEIKGIGEVSDDLIRKAIQTQHETLPFWTTLALIGDFLVEPSALAARALLVATVFAAIAALVGRPVQYDRSMAECARLQGIWVFGLAVRVALILALRRGDVETSLALVLPAGTYPAPAWLALRQLDLFAVVGWGALARGGWRRGQASLGAAIGLCALLALAEATLRILVGLVIGSGMRLVTATT